jgi:hypothetical protein
MVILIFTVTAAESGCGLSLLVAYFLNEFELQGYYQRLVKHNAFIRIATVSSTLFNREQLMLPLFLILR